MQKKLQNVIKIFTLAVMLLGVNVTWGQTTIIARDQFETTASTPNINFTISGGAYQTGSTASNTNSAAPANSPKYSEGARGYGVTNTTATLTSGNINTSNYTSVAFTCKLASFSINSSGNGADAGDFIKVEISPNGGANYYLRSWQAGASNATWAFTNSSTYTNTYSTANLTAAGNTSAAGTLTITGLPSAANVRIRITIFNDNANELWSIDDVQVTGTSTASNLTPPTLTAAPSATVDAPFNVTFTDDAAWRGAITGITVGGTTLASGAYSVAAGQITFTPSAATLLQSSGSKAIVVSATGYNTASVSQTINAGAANKLAIGTQPAAPASNGAVLATQPIVNIVDQYGNATASTAQVVATVGAGSWTIGGTTTKAGVSGVATFTNLTATASAAVTGATITFTSTGLTQITSSAFNIPGPAAPALTAAANATVDGPFIVTFTDNATWRSNITSITVGGNTLAAAAYSVAAGQITFTPSASTLLQSSGTKAIVVIATGFANGTVSQVINAGVATKLAITTQPAAPATNGSTLGTQPVVVIRDQYNNLTTSTAAVTATIGAGTWTIGGTNPRNGVSGTATFTNLTATSAAAVTGATITFTSPGLTSITSGTFNIPTPPIANDNCSGAIALALGVSAVTGDVTGATQSIAPINCTTTTDDSDDDVWYSFTTTTAAVYTVTVVGSASFDAIIDLRSGACNGTNIDCADVTYGGGTETITRSLSANTTYYVRVYDYSTGTPSTPTFTIAVTAAPPVATAATSVGFTGFTANWNTLASATSYKLDVATTSAFGYVALSENFSLFTSSSPSINVGSNSAYFNTSGFTGTNVFDANNGFPRIGTGSNAGNLTTPTLDLSANGGSNTVTVDIKKYSTDASTNTVQVMYSSNGGSSYTQLGTNISPGTDFATYTFNITGGTANSKIRIQNVAGNQRFHIDNLSIGYTTILPSYNNLSVTPTSKAVTGLTEGTNYYYRVRALTPAGTTDNSNVITVRTGTTLTWNGTQWTGNVTPTTADNGIIAGAYTPPATTGLTINNLTVNSGGSVNIPSNRTITVAGTLTNNAPAANFTIQDNGALVQTATGAATNSTAITVYKYSNPLYRLDYTLWSAPTVGQTLRQFSMGTSNNRFYEYVSSSTADEGYYPVDPLTTSFDASNRGKGWLIRMPNTIAADVTGTTNDLVTTPAEYVAGTDNYYFQGTFVGAPNTGDIAYSLNTAGGRYNAVGNPYSSPINIASFFTTNSTALDSGTLYFWRKRNNTTGTGSYATLTLADYLPNSTGDNATNATGGQNSEQFYDNANSANWTIAPGQGFLVKAATTATALTFNNAMRKAAPTSGGQAFLRTAASQVSRYRMRVATAEGDASQMSVVYMPQGSLGLDYGYDGKLLGDAALSLYTLAENASLSIQARPEFDVTDVVAAGYKANTAGTYTIALSYTDGVFANGQKIYLKDKAEGVIREMGTADYTFTSEAGTFEDRFEIVYTTTALGTDTPVLNANTVIVYQNGGTVNINSGSAVISSVNVFDIRGRKLYTADKVNATEAAINNLTATQQVLIVEINTDKGTVTKKIVF